MHTVKLGQSQTDISAMCLGCMHFGTTVSQDDCFAIMDTYYEGGGRFLDTSNNYAFWADGAQGGESERVIGAWLATRGCREEMFVATKLGANPTVPGSGFETAEGLSAAAIASAVDGSLNRLGIDQIDLLYAHIEDRNVALEESLGALNAMVADGHARHLGASNHAVWRLERARAMCENNGWAQFDAIQQGLSYLVPQRLYDGGVQRFADPELYDYLRHGNPLTLVGYSIQLDGVYEGRPGWVGYDTSENAARMQVLQEIAKKLNVGVSQLVVAWVMRQTDSAVPLISSSKPARLKAMMGALDISLDQDDLSRMSTAGWVKK